MTGVVAYIDGGARGNPGPAGFGVRVESPDGTLIDEFSESIGTATNNVAEYRGLLAALEWAKTHEHRALHVRSDSLLLVQQMLGRYKVKNEGLKPLHAKARMLAYEIGKVTFEHVRRESNAHADRLANTAMDGAEGKTPKTAPVNAPAAEMPDESFADVAAALFEAVAEALQTLRRLSDSDASRPRAIGKWSPKQIIGHLVDSAANNHQRFVRAQQSAKPALPSYDQESWVDLQGYESRDWTELLTLWEHYNRHLVHVLGRIPDEKAGVRCAIGSSSPVTLAFLARDYVDHLQHHVRQILA